MKLQPIDPPLREGQRVWCVGGHLAACAKADLDAPTGTYYCLHHEPHRIEVFSNRDKCFRCGDVRSALQHRLP